MMRKAATPQPTIQQRIYARFHDLFAAAQAFTTQYSGGGQGLVLLVYTGAGAQYYRVSTASDGPELEYRAARRLSLEVECYIGPTLCSNRGLAERLLNDGVVVPPAYQAFGWAPNGTQVTAVFVTDAPTAEPNPPMNVYRFPGSAELPPAVASAGPVTAEFWRLYDDGKIVLLDDLIRTHPGTFYWMELGHQRFVVVDGDVQDGELSVPRGHYFVGGQIGKFKGGDPLSQTLKPAYDLARLRKR